MSYWANRQKQLNQTAEKEESKLKKRLSKYYDSEFRKLEKQISAYYQEYGENNVIEYRKLMEALSDDDKRLLIEQMDEFAKKYPQYAHLTPVRESIYKLNRLEGLQYSVIMRQAEIAGLNNDEIASHLNRLAVKGLNYGMETLGFGKNFYSVNSDIVKKFVDVPWSNGENFSKRIWNDTQKLAQYLNQDIAQGIARGDSYDRLVRQLRQRFSSVNRRDAYRLVYTEGTYVMAESTMQPFSEDFEYYKLSPLMDEKTCPICRGLADKVFKISERQPGVNFPPIHPWCRCTWEIVVGDWDKWIDDYVKKHGGDKKHAEQVANRFDSGIIKKNRGILKINLQLFAESDIKNQGSGSLRRAIRKYEKQIKVHKEKMSHPEQYIPDWGALDPRMQEGLKRHWNKEIRNFSQSIQDRIDELKARGDYDD